MYWNHLLIVMAACAVGAAIGFTNFLWFITVGYGLAVSCGSLATLIISVVNGNCNWLLILQCLVLFVYGLRLGLFLLIRELKNAGYKKYKKESVTTEGKKTPFFVSICMWLYCGFLYAGEMSPVFFRMENNDYDNVVLPVIGLIISILGVVIEAAADKQKSVQKAENPNMVATKGLYKYSRCANYFGEITQWTGVMIGGLDTLNTLGQWLLAVLSYICIVYIMLDGAKRTEARQTKRYGKDPEYMEYFNKTPVIIPFVPLYHLNKFDENGMPVEKKK